MLVQQYSEEEEVISRSESSIVEDILPVLNTRDGDAVEDRFYSVYADRGVCSGDNAARNRPSKLCHGPHHLPGHIETDTDA